MLAGPAAQKKRSSQAPLAAGIAALLMALAGGAWWFLEANRPAAVATKSPAPVASNVTMPAEARRLSLVVLPFANLSNDPSQDYFADGVTENLTTDLSRLSGAFVIARNTGFTFKGKNVDAREIGKELGVRYVLEGSVQRDPGQVRVNVQLIDAETGNHLWADRFDKPLTDLFEMQDEIVARLANQLGTELTAAEARRAQQAPNPDSMDLYFQGLASFNKGISLENMDHARGFFERALTLDPGNVDAALGVGRADFIVGAAHLSDDTPARLAAAEAMMGKVLSLRPNDALAHETLGGVMTQTKRSDQAIPEFERALALDPNLASAHASIGNAKMFIGRAGETEADENEALRLSPRDSFASVWLLMAGGAKLNSWGRRGGRCVAPPQYRAESKLAVCPFLSRSRPRESRQAGRGAGRDPGRTDARFDFHNPAFPRRPGERQPDFLGRKGAHHRRHAEGWRARGVSDTGHLAFAHWAANSRFETRRACRRQRAGILCAGPLIERWLSPRCNVQGRDRLPPLNVDSSRPVSSNSGLCPTARRTGSNRA